MPRMVGPAVRRGAKRSAKGAKGATGAPKPPPRVVTGEVLDRKAPDYHGRFGTGAPKAEWANAHNQKAYDNIGDNLGHNLARIDDDFHRSMGKTTAAVLAGTAGLSLGIGELARAQHKKENRRIRAALARPRPAYQGMAKGWDRNDPYMWHAEDHKGAHKVTILGEKEKRAAERAPKHAKDLFARIGRATEGPKGAYVTTAALTGASLLALPRSVGPAIQGERLKERARRKGLVIKAQDARRERNTAIGATGAVGLAASPVGRRVLEKPTPLQADTRSWLNDSKLQPGRGMSRIRAAAATKAPSPLGRQFHTRSAPSTKHLFRGAEMDADPEIGSEHHFDMSSFSEKEHQGLRFAGMRARKAKHRTVMVMEPGARSLDMKHLYDHQTDTFGSHRRKAEHLVHGPAKVTQVRHAGGVRYVHLASVVKRATIKPAEVKSLLGRNKHNLVAPAAGLAIGGAAVEGSRLAAHHTGRSDSHQRDVPAVAAGAYGLHRFKQHGMGIKAKFDAVAGTELPGQSRSQRQKLESQWRRKHGVPMDSVHRQKRFLESHPQALADYPKELAGASHRHALARLSGSRGRKLEAASVALPMAAVGLYRSKVDKSDKTYGYMETRRNPYRTAELGVGLGVGAWGASRLQVGSQVGRGVRIAQAKGKGQQAKGLVDRGRKARDTTRRITGQGEAGLRNRIPGFGTALDKIPKHLQPRVATGIGALLAVRAIPTHDERFVASGGW
jgi:hypothetical protein